MPTTLHPFQFIEAFIDADTWIPIMADAVDPGSGGPGRESVVCGTGMFRGRRVCLYVQDLSVHFGTIGETHGRKVAATIDRAIHLRCPVIGIISTGGARIQQGSVGLAAASLMARRTIAASGFIPTIAVVAGPGAGGGAYLTTLSDFAIMLKEDAYVFLTGPKVVKRVLNESITASELGGADAHFTRSGIIQYVAAHIGEAMDISASLLSHLPSWCGDAAPVIPYTADGREIRPELNAVLPVISQAGYDMERILTRLTDAGSLLQHNRGFAENVITAFGRIGGRSIGIVANQPEIMGGVLDVDATRKIGRFVQICDAYNVPLLFVVDCPGYLPGRAQEWAGLTGKGAYMTHLISAATVPKVTLIVRKAIGGAYATLNSRQIGGDYTIAWTSAQISVVGMDSAMELLREKSARDRRDEEPERADRMPEAEFLSPYPAAARGLVDEVIEPAESRGVLIRVFSMLEHKCRHPEIRKKRSIMPMV